MFVRMQHETMAFRIVAQLGGQPTRFLLKAGENLVGSHRSCEVFLDHPTVSRHHAVLLVVDEKIQVADFGSENGTWVDSVRVQQPVDLEAPAEFSFGAVKAVIEQIPDEDTVAAPLPDFGWAEIPASPSSESSAPTSKGTTASVGPLHLFTLGYLPEMVGALSDGIDQAHLAPRLVAILTTCLPCHRVEVMALNGKATLAEAGEEKEGEGTWAEVGDPALTLRVQFASAGSASLYHPLLEASRELLVIANLKKGRGRTGPGLPRSRVAPPDPPSVDPVVRDLYEKAAVIAEGDVNVLIRGDSGTGKEVLARYLHRASLRRDGPFVALNCPALPSDLLESELFGIESGVATGVSSRPGKFELADGGTLFLDEIGDMAPESQAKILRVLQEGEVFRLGGREARPASVRVVSATNRDLDKMRREEKFRDDLYHRIADWVVRLPNLSERRADIPNLGAFFLAREAKRLGRRVVGISQAALRALVSYDWPGNIRQLEREMARAVLFAGQDQLLDLGCLQDAIREEAANSATEDLKDFLERVEKKEISRVLLEQNGDVGEASARLGVPVSSLYRRIKRLGIET